MPVDAGTSTSPRRRGSARGRLPGGLLRGGLLRAAALGTVVAVALVSGGGSSPSAPRALHTAPVSLNDPAPPASLALTPADAQITASWPASTESYLRGYVVSVDGTARPEQTGLTATLTGLTNGRTYAIAVRTVTYNGGLAGIGAQGPFTGTQAATASTYPRDSVVPAAPTAITATAGESQVTVGWTANTTDADVAGYVVYRGGTAVSGLLPGTATSWTDTGLTDYTTYTYTVRTQDTSKNLSADSPSRAATPTDLTPPAVPTGLTAARGDGRVVLRWTAGTDADLASYGVYRGGVLIATVTRPATTYTDTGLTNDTAYAYAVDAVDTHANRSATSSPAVSATPTDLTAPAAPTGLAAVRGDGQVSLSWTASPEPDLAGYQLYRGATLVATIAAPATAYTDTGLTNDTTYKYSLVAVDTHANASAASAPLVSATPTDLTAPAVPTGLSAVRGDKQVGLSWTASTESDLASYRLYRDGTLVATVNAPATSYNNTGLTNDTTYAYTISAVDTHGNASAQSSPPVGATPTDLTPPAAPKGLAATAGDGQVALAWTGSPEPDLASYRLYRDGALVATITKPTKAYTDTGVTNGTTYSYALVAVDTHDNASPASAAVSATPADTTAPATPTGLTAVPGDAQVTLSWTASPETDLAGYQLYRGPTLVATITAPATTYTDTGLTNGTKYTYALIAVDTSGNASSRTPAASATPVDTPPAVPTGLAALRGDGRVALSWSPNTEPDLAGYRLYRGGVLLATVTQPTTTYTDTAVTNGTTYSYTISAVDAHGNESARSAPVTATPTDLTPPAVPTGLVASRGDTTVSLTWNAGSDADLATVRVLRDGAVVASLGRTSTSYTDTGLTDDQQYSYSLVAVDAAGNASAASSPVRATPTDLTPPPAPTGVSATAGDASAQVRWDAVTVPDLAAYRVLRADGSTAVTVPAPTTTATVTGLTNGVATSLRVVAVDTHGNTSSPSAAVWVTPADTTPPLVPTGVTVAPGAESLTASWTAVSATDLSYYRVLVDGAVAGTVPAGTTTLKVTGLVGGRSYAVTVVAVDTSGNASAASAPVTGVPVDTTPPPVPTGVTATPSDAAVTVTWTAVAAADLASYTVYRDGAAVVTVPAGTTTTTVTGLVNGTTYAFTVVATDAAGNASAPSAAVTATPVASAPPADTTPPAVPTGVTATGGDHSLVVSWGAVADADLASYRVLLDGTAVATPPAGTTTATVGGLLDGHTYVVTVVAVDTAGNASAASTPVSATTRDTTAPAAPTGVTSTAGDGSATVRWSPVSAPDLASYTVYRDGAAVATVPAGTTTTTVTGLANGTTYAFTVVATDTAGNASGASVSASVTPAPAPPTSPSTPSTPATGAGELGGLAATRDGRYVVVGTKAQLEAGDRNSSYELYLLDRVAGTSRRVAPLPSTWSGAGTDSTNSSAVALSADGRYLALATKAALVTTDNNQRTDVYRLDLTTGTARLVSVPSGGKVSSVADGTVTPLASGSNYATAPSVAISADGDRVLFYSARTDLVPGDTGTAVGLFAKDMTSGAVTRVSTTSSGGVLSATVQGPALALTPDGRYALFPASGSGTSPVLYRKDLVTKELVVASTAVSASGTATPVPVSRDTGDVAVSDDGRYVAFSTAAKVGTSTPGATWSTALAYRKDVVTGALAALGSGQTTVWEHQGALDPTGRYGFFETAAGEVAGDTNGHTDVYRRDLSTGTLTLVTSDASGAPAGPGTTGSVSTAEYGPILALSGDTVLVATLQPLVAGDTNGVRDVYRKDVSTGAVASVV